MFRVQHLYLTFLDRIQILKDEIESIGDREFSDEDPLIVIRTLSVIVNCIEAQAKSELSTAPTESDKDAYLKLISTYIFKLELVHDMLGVIANGTKSSVPWALTRVVREILGCVAPTNIHVIYAPIWTLNFAIHPHRLEQLYEGLEPILEATAEGQELRKNLPRIIEINFSYLDRKSPLLYGILGHEIGHIFSSEYFEKNSTLDHSWMSTNLSPLLTGKPMKDQIAFLSDLNAVRKRAIEEVGADLFALYVAGPAFVFSVFDVLSRLAVDDSMPSPRNKLYPSNRFRMKAILDALKSKWDFDNSTIADTDDKKVFQKGLKSLASIINKSSPVENGAPDPRINLAYKYLMQKDIPQMLTELSTKVIKPFDYSKFFSNSASLVGRLENNIPPNQYGVELNTWVDSISILNVTWLSELKAIISKDWSDLANDGYLSQLHLQDRLSLKAIELSEIQRSYQEEEK